MAPLLWSQPLQTDARKRYLVEVVLQHGRLVGHEEQFAFLLVDMNNAGNFPFALREAGELFTLQCMPIEMVIAVPFRDPEYLITTGESVIIVDFNPPVLIHFHQSHTLLA